MLLHDPTSSKDYIALDIRQKKVFSMIMPHSHILDQKGQIRLKLTYSIAKKAILDTKFVVLESVEVFHSGPRYRKTCPYCICMLSFVFSFLQLYAYVSLPS